MKNESSHNHTSTSYHLQITQLQQLNTELKDKLAQQQHSMKKELLVLETQLNFQRKKGQQFQQKWKQLVKSDEQNKLKILCTQLTNDISLKEHDIMELKKKEFEKKKRINELEEEMKRLKDGDEKGKVLAEDNRNLKSDIEKIKETAVKALMDKDSLLQELEDKLKQYEQGQYKNIDISYQLTENKEKYQELQYRYQKLEKDHDEQNYQNKTEISQLKQRLEAMKIRTQERSAILEQDILEYQKYIEELKREKSQETILTRSLDDIQDKYRKTEKKMYDLETELQDLKTQRANEVKKYENELGSCRNKIEILKTLQANYLISEKELYRLKKSSQKQIQDLKYQIQKLNQINKQSLSKILELNAQRNRLIEDIQEYKKSNSELLASNEQLKQNYSQLIQKHSELQNWSPEKQQSTLSQDLSYMQSSKKQFPLPASLPTASVLDDRFCQLQQQLDQKILQNQQLRLKILQLSQSSSTQSSTKSTSPFDQEDKNIILQLEDYRQHINKLQNNILIIKLRYAEDESFWIERQKIERAQFAEKNKKLVKEKGELYEKLEKLRKGKGERRGMYVSALK